MEVYGKQNLIVTTLKGLEEVLEKEINSMGIEGTEAINRGVSIPYSQRNLYQVNMAARVALRVLVPVFQFEAESTEDLYEQAIKFPWDKFQNIDQTFAIYNAVNSSIFHPCSICFIKNERCIV
jgi:putative N6-adenine-specific DNA methylase